MGFHDNVGICYFIYVFNYKINQVPIVNIFDQGGVKWGGAGRGGAA